MSANYELKVFKSADELAEEAAEFIIRLSEESIKARDRFIIALSGGTTPERLFRVLAEPSYAEKVNIEKTFVFWSDERCVPFNDERNNAHKAQQLLLNNICIPAENIFAMPVNLPPAEAAEAYEKTLHGFLGDSERFDLILLGLGEDGHTASLFPDTDILNEHKRWVKEVYPKTQPEPRITLTTPFINRARNILFLVSGENKREILQQVLNNKSAGQYPAQLIHPTNGNLYWYTDIRISN
jgi:6-phosphogluconolactonase